MSAPSHSTRSSRPVKRRAHASLHKIEVEVKVNARVFVWSHINRGCTDSSPRRHLGPAHTRASASLERAHTMAGGGAADSNSDVAAYVRIGLVIFGVVVALCLAATSICVYKRVKKQRERRTGYAEAARHPSLAHRRHYYRSNTSVLFPRRVPALRNPLFLPECVPRCLSRASSSSPLRVRAHSCVWCNRHSLSLMYISVCACAFD